MLEHQGRKIMAEAIKEKNLHALYGTGWFLSTKNKIRIEISTDNIYTTEEFWILKIHSAYSLKQIFQGSKACFK